MNSSLDGALVGLNQVVFLQLVRLASRSGQLGRPALRWPALASKASWAVGSAHRPVRLGRLSACAAASSARLLGHFGYRRPFSYLKYFLIGSRIKLVKSI
jgi:hypothetical protein